MVCQWVPTVLTGYLSIGAGTKILAGTHIEGAEIGKETTIGPVARLRPGTVLGDGCKIGNFVETKNAVIGEGSKNHLAYIGDAVIGDDCNIGAGAVFCNYDGANKHQTTLGNHVFVGSNSVLIAPVTLEDNAFVAAGSSVSSDVPAGSLAVARVKQRNVPGWKKAEKKVDRLRNFSDPGRTSLVKPSTVVWCTQRLLAFFQPLQMLFKQWFAVQSHTGSQHIDDPDEQSARILELRPAGPPRY